MGVKIRKCYPTQKQRKHPVKYGGGWLVVLLLGALHKRERAESRALFSRPGRERP